MLVSGEHLNVLNFSPADDLTPCKITAIRLLLLGKLYILVLKEVRDCYRALIFFPASIHVLDTSSNCFLLALKAQPSSGVLKAGLQMRLGLQKRHFVCKGLDHARALPLKVKSLLELTA